MSYLSSLFTCALTVLGRATWSLRSRYAATAGANLLQSFVSSQRYSGVRYRPFMLKCSDR
jgi:hypothetical protein